MRNFVKRGLRNPFWIVTKAGIPTEAVDELINISRDLEKIILSLCWANNPKEIEPVTNNRFMNIEKVKSGNISVNWYLRPISKEWLKDINKLESMFKEVSEAYAEYLDCIIPGGLRWTEGIEYGLVEVRNLELPNISKVHTTKTLNSDDWIMIEKLSKQYFPHTPLYYHSSCGLSLALKRSNVNMVNYTKKNDCKKSTCDCEQRERCRIQDNVNSQSIQEELNKIEFGVKVKSFSQENGVIETIPEYKSLAPALQLEIDHIIAILNEKKRIDNNKFNYKSNEKIKAVFEKIKGNKKVESIAVVRSALSKNNPNDIDVLVLVNNVENNNEATEVIKNSLKDYNMVNADDSIRLIDAYDLEINIAVFDINYFKNRIDNIFNNNHIYPEYRGWCLGYWLPEVLFKDIASAEIYFEKEDNAYLSKLNVFIKRNKGKVLHRIEQECLININGIKNRLQNINKENLLELQIIKNNLILEIIRYKFIKYNEVGTSIKYIDKLFKKDKNFKHNMEELAQKVKVKDILEITEAIV